MKRFISALIAGAMILSMSVTSFAADTWTTFGSGDGENAANVSNIFWNNVIVVNEDDDVRKAYSTTSAAAGIEDIEDGDVFYFPISTSEKINDKTESNNWMTGKADSDWKIKLKGDEYVKSATFKRLKTSTTLGEELWKALKDLKASDEKPEYMLYVKVTLEDDVNVYDDDSAFTFYINDEGTTSEKVKVLFDFVETKDKDIEEDDLDWALSVNKTTEYNYDEDSAAKKATIEFSDVATGEFKMYPDETYKLGVSIDYNKALSQEWDTDVEVMNFTLGNVGNIDLALLADEEAYQVVAGVDGELVPVEATYVEDHKFADGSKVDGYLVENAEYTAYALIDADVEIEVEAEEEVEAPVVEADKANPETGAGDFVGMASAMAVMAIVAGAGLMISKK